MTIGIGTPHPSGTRRNISGSPPFQIASCPHPTRSMAAPQVATLLPTEPPRLDRSLSEASLDDVQPWSEPRFIVQSPYTELKHQLDLTKLDYENALLAKALSTLDATRQDYAVASYTESFNWTDVSARLKALVSIYGQRYQDATFYIVAFRSQIKPSTDYSHLGELDKAAHLEAIESGGFLKYVVLVWRPGLGLAKFGHMPLAVQGRRGCRRTRPRSQKGGHVHQIVRTGRLFLGRTRLER
ncbi:UPF0643 protein [Cordyceps militaris CM01]|uniref:UPF0643 protein n=1 Tax=Cordyceps militaris (strain CM01) TaxID=983644 RepID=G3JME7_CORMM|nr:UPF0643 protein [Cordyceps militaris CM01]EGX90826.1 UPF0643 protein [Cordyceps militaris CM01]